MKPIPLYSIKNLHIKIGKERKSMEEIRKISQLLSEKSIKRIFAVGGGSIIDFT